jgi:hypothetical protein
MNLKARKPFLVLLLVAVMLASALGMVRYSGLCQLRNVTFEPESFAGDIELMDPAIGQNLFDAPTDDVINRLLDRKDVIRVDYDYILPDEINIKVNRIRPIALIICNTGGELYFLDDHYLLLPCDDEIGYIDFPVITGLGNCTAFKKVQETRMPLVIRQLGRLKEDCTDFYLAISSIDMSNSESISLYLDGLPCRIDVNAGSLYDSLKNLRAFLLDFNPDLSEIDRLDMTNEGLIISAG